MIIYVCVDEPETAFKYRVRTVPSCTTVNAAQIALPGGKSATRVLEMP